MADIEKASESRVSSREAAARVGVLCALMAAAMAVSACNTMEGAGKDIEEGGEAIQDAAD